MGHQGSVERKVKAIEYLDSRVIKPVKEGLEAAGEDFRMLVLPDHPTPICMRTHSSDSVPYLLYDSTDFQNREKTNSTASENNSTESTEDFTGNGKVTNSGTKTIANSGNETNDVSRETSDNNTGETTHEQTETGNIGITLTQRMITAEREIAMFNIIDFIINDFKERFCLLIY